MLVLSACKGAPRDRPPPPSTPTLTSAPTAPPTFSQTTDPAPTVSTVSPPSPDASAATCRVLRGPIELPLRAAASLAVRDDTVDAVLNEDGRPRIVSFPAGPVSASAAAPRESGDPASGLVARGISGLNSGRNAGLVAPCAVAGERVYCTDRTGAVHRTTRAGAEDHVVASARSMSRIAAAPIGGTHVALAYLASRQTSEGWVSEAWLAVDDDPPLRVSEDGSGATALALAPRGLALLALMVDARAALTAMHARMVTYDHAVRLGEDAVVFVGGPGDRRTRGALAVPSSGPAWSLLPIAKDVGSFGLAIVRLDEPPRVDEPVVWSMYPNGLDPAPIAAVSSGGRTPATWVARVRPRAAEPASPRVLELGQIASDGAFTPRDTVPTTGSATDVSLALDPSGALWLAWVDGVGSWLERLACR